jgi:hypothetical protein
MKKPERIVRLKLVLVKVFQPEPKLSTERDDEFMFVQPPERQAIVSSNPNPVLLKYYFAV